MLEKDYEGYGYDTVERFVPLDVQLGTTYDSEKDKSQITYTERESFFGEEVPKEAELVIPICDKKTSGIADDEKDKKINSERTYN